MRQSSLIKTKHGFFDKHNSTREIIEQHLEGKLYLVKQVHGSVIVEAPFEEKQTGDALITNRKGVILGIQTADCVPVLVYDAVQQVVAAVHAGWRGAFDGVIQNTLKAMQAYGCKPGNITAAIGPCIQQKSYEVDAIFYNQFVKQHKANKIFFQDAQKVGHYLFDLPAYVLKQLETAGIKQIDNLAEDTYTQPKNYYSYRYASHNSIEIGRLISAIVLPSI